MAIYHAVIGFHHQHLHPPVQLCWLAMAPIGLLFFASTNPGRCTTASRRRPFAHHLLTSITFIPRGTGRSSKSPATLPHLDYHPLLIFWSICNTPFFRIHLTRRQLRQCLFRWRLLVTVTRAKENRTTIQQRYRTSSFALMTMKTSDLLTFPQQPPSRLNHCHLHPSRLLIQIPPTTDMASTTLPQPFQPAFAVPAPLLPCADAEADDSDSASVANSQSSQVPQGHRRHRKRLGMPPKRDNRAERERTAENKVRQASSAMEQLASAGFIPAAPTHHASSTDPTSSHSHASSSQPVGDVYSLPQVTCTNVPAVPTTQRARFHVVVNDFCTNCLLRADSTGHASAERFIFASREAFQQYWDSHHHGDTHNEPL